MIRSPKMLVILALAVVAIVAVLIIKRRLVISDMRVLQARFKGKSLVINLVVDSTKIQSITNAFVHPHKDAYRMHLLSSEGPSSGSTTVFGITRQHAPGRMLHHSIEFDQIDTITSDEKKMINSLEVVGTRPDGNDCNYKVDFEVTN